MASSRSKKQYEVRGGTNRLTSGQERAHGNDSGGRHRGSNSVLSRAKPRELAYVRITRFDKGGENKAWRVGSYGNIIDLQREIIIYTNLSTCSLSTPLSAGS